MKKRYIGGLTLIIILLVVVYNLGQQSNKSDSLVSKPDKQSQITDCAQQAQLVLKNEQKRGDEYTSYSQTNHYNSQLNKCFLQLHTIISDSKGVIFTTEVRDAYEQKTFMSCVSGSSIDSSCFIPGNQSATGQAIYMTKEEGEAQMQNYMNN